METNDERIGKIYLEIQKDMWKAGILPGDVNAIFLSDEDSKHSGLYALTSDGKVYIYIFARNVPQPGTYAFREVLAHEMLHAAANQKAGRNVDHGSPWKEMADAMNRTFPDKYHIQEYTGFSEKAAEDYGYFLKCGKCGNITGYMSKEQQEHAEKTRQCTCGGELVKISKEEALRIAQK